MGIENFETVFDSGDMADWEPLDVEHAIITALKANGWAPLGPPSTPIHHMTAMLAEIKRKRHLLKSDITDEELATPFRLFRMELSRHEMLPDFDQMLEEALLESSSEVNTVNAALQAKYRKNLQTETVLKNMDSGLLKLVNNRLEQEAEDIRALSTMAVRAAEEEAGYKEIGVRVKQWIADTNLGLHAQQVDATGVRKTDERTVLFLENLTKIWIKHADPTLGLPIRSKDETNPYLRFLTHGLLFFNRTDLSPLQLNSLAKKYFKETLIPE